MFRATLAAQVLALAVRDAVARDEPYKSSEKLSDARGRRGRRREAFDATDDASWAARTDRDGRRPSAA